MSQLTAGAHAHDHHHHHGHHAPAADLSERNITLTGAGFSPVLIGLGVALLAVAGYGWTVAGASHALSMIHVGVLTATAVSLGALFLLMAFHLTMAGWSVTVRRQFENIASMIPYCGVAVIAVLLTDILLGGQVFPWLNKAVVGQGAERDYLFAKKEAFLNPVFFMIRAVLYVFAWSYLAWRLVGYSKEQDRTGDKWLSNRARFTSAWGLLVFAITVAFAGFDWLKSIDWRYFSTMWGVYFFAGAIYAATASAILVLALIRRSGRLEGLVTAEHTHDLGKMLFAFTVFWAYISYSQYFLTWYANIPEETSFYLARKTGGWEYLFYGLAFGHFVLPFYFLLWRFARRSLGVLALFAAWSLLMQAADLYWIVRPQLYAQDADRVRLGLLWIDVAAIGGVVLVYFGLLWRKVAGGVLIPTRDPRLPEALVHKNYV